MKGSSDLKEYILFMHSDGERSEKSEERTAYFSRLHESGRFQGGSAIGDGECLRKDATPGQLPQLIGRLHSSTCTRPGRRKNLRDGNPVFEAGGTVEIRELPKTS